jgi:16S rRNA processing protein RimM
VVEEGVTLGKISEMQRLAEVNYMFIETDAKLIEEGFATTFLVPYIERYVIETDVEKQTVNTKDAKEILEAS